MNENGNTPRPLWTRDFTIITLGSVVSMLGNALSGFAMSLMVLDISKSTLLYAIYIAMYTLPQLFMPIVSGAILDRFSRKRTIYSLDFLSAFLYALMAAILATGWFSFPFFAVYCFLLGSIQSTYMVAYESFYPLLISEGNFQKAYSIASVLETFSAVMVPVSAFLYRKIGLSPLLAINALCFLIAAIMETQIRADEQYLVTQRETRDHDLKASKQMLRDIREGFAYLRSEKGLLAIALYFAFSAITGGVSTVIVLPWFKSVYENGEYLYMLVWGMALLGRAIGGMVHYRVNIPPKYRYRTALTVYIVISVLEGVYLFTPIPVMMALCFIVGIGGITSYTIRISATQSYVPDERKGRFNGAFNMISTAGALLGEVLAGGLTLLLPERIVLLGAMLLCAMAAIIFIGGGREHVAYIYNRTQ
jgi:MFS family permease